jgi:mitochondrial fission protein ELM1
LSAAPAAAGHAVAGVRAAPETTPPPSARWALVLGDGKPGHENQSLALLPEGITPWRFRVRYPSLWAFLRACLAARLPALSDRAAGPFPWGGLVADADRLAALLAESPAPALVLSAGSGPAPLALLLARRLGCPAVTCMTPSVGTGGFALACVPRHDRARGPRIVPTLGAPNRVDPESLRRAADEFRAAHGLGEGPFMALLMGGDTPRQRISPRLADDILDGALRLARARGAGLLVTTSRRTSPEAEARVAARAGECAFLCRGRTDPENPVPGMLGLADLALVTEDSVSMVSEAASAPCRVLTVAVGGRGLGVPRRHRAALRALSAAGYVARTTAAGLVADGVALLAQPPPPVLDESRRCREAVAHLVGP